MRILTVGNMYPPHHLGGYELMWESWVRHARRAGHEVEVLTTDHREDGIGVPDPPGVSRTLRWYWRDHAFPRLGPAARLRLERHNLSELSRRLESPSPPEAVCWWAMGGMSLSLLEWARRAGVPATAVVVDDWLVYGPGVDAWQRAMGRRRTLARLAERLTKIPTGFDIDACARWLCVSERVRDRARAEGLSLPDAEIVNAGTDPDAFPAAPAAPWDWRLLYVGRIDPRKGIATAIRALASLPEATLTIVGDGDRSHRDDLGELVAEVGVGPRVSFERHPRAELARVYANADAVLFPVQWEEPWGLVPLEAMSVGRPVVATGTGGSGEYLVDGENCLLFRPRDDPGALATAVRRLADDEPLRRRLRTGGLATAERFTEEKFNSAVLDAVTGATA